MPSGHFLQLLKDGLILLIEIDGPRAGYPSKRQTFRNVVDFGYACGAEHQSALDAELPDGPAAPDRDESAGSISQLSAAIQPVGKMSPKNSACSSLIPFGITIGETSA
jgi:hypothetical protein